jgi:hypothetical protein
MHISLLWSSDKLLRNWLSTLRASGAWEEGFASKIFQRVRIGHVSDKEDYARWKRAYPGAFT